MNVLPHEHGCQTTKTQHRRFVEYEVGSWWLVGGSGQWDGDSNPPATTLATGPGYGEGIGRPIPACEDCCTAGPKGATIAAQLGPRSGAEPTRRLTQPGKRTQVWVAVVRHGSATIPQACDAKDLMVDRLRRCAEGYQATRSRCCVLKGATLRQEVWFFPAHHCRTSASKSKPFRNEIRRERMNGQA